MTFFSPVAPSSSVTLSFTVYELGALKVWVAFCLLLNLPSPKDQFHWTIFPSVSVPEPVNETVSGATPELRSTLMMAVGALLGTGSTSISAVAVALAESSSVTNRVTV